MFLTTECISFWVHFKVWCQGLNFGSSYASTEVWSEVIVLSFPGFHHVQIVIWRKHEKRTKYHQNFFMFFIVNSALGCWSWSKTQRTQIWIRGGLTKYTYQYFLVRFHYLLWYVFSTWFWYWSVVPKTKKKGEILRKCPFFEWCLEYRYVRDTIMVFGRSHKSWNTLVLTVTTFYRYVQLFFVWKQDTLTFLSFFDEEGCYPFTQHSDSISINANTFALFESCYRIQNTFQQDREKKQT